MVGSRQDRYDQTTIRHIATRELVECVANGEVIEDYPDDKYGPSCLILGTTLDGRPLHVQIGYPDAGPVKVVTAYEPDAGRWDDGFRFRRAQPR